LEKQEGKEMPKITLIGAGSAVFTKVLVGDILLFPELADSEICLMDIDEERLDLAGKMAQKVADSIGAPAKIVTTTDREKALEGADFVFNTIQVGGYDSTLVDFDIPEKYGLKQTIADTLGVGGIFRTLRSIPVMWSICEDMERICPDAYLLNYSNPMAMNMWAIYERTKIRNVGLCHSVQGTSMQIAGYLDIPHKELKYEVFGINHMAWFTKLEHNGKDMYPKLFEAMEDPEKYKTNKVRFEIMRYFGYFVTESSEHMAEYTPWFIKHENLIEELDIPIREYVRRCDSYVDLHEENKKSVASPEPFEIKSSCEYGSRIIHAITTNQAKRIHGNVKNEGLITNLPEGCCVEVLCNVDSEGIKPQKMGDLPTQLVALNRTNINVQELAVKGLLEGKREYIYHAAYMDPLTSSVLPLSDIKKMVDELFEVHAKYLNF
jgi:alpha-galactosidase